MARHVAYPAYAERQGVYAKIYAGFDIDRKGHVNNVHILSPVKVGYGFEEEVVKKLRRLPPLHPKYQGEYAVPMVFAYIDYGQSASPLKPAGTLPHWYFANRTLLKEITITGSSIGHPKGQYKAQSHGVVYETDH